MFTTLYFDPPWDFNNKKTGGSHKSGAGQKYPTMSLAAIQQLPVPAVAAPNSVLFLWVPTSMKFSHGGTVLDAWGYRYITTVYWQKTYTGRRMGMGFWFRNQVEELLVAARGSVRPFGCQLPNILTLPVEEHSAKPEGFRRLIEDATKETSSRRNLEGFARRKVPGWTGIGNQVTGNDIRMDLHTLALQAARGDR